MTTANLPLGLNSTIASSASVFDAFENFYYLQWLIDVPQLSMKFYLAALME